MMKKRIGVVMLCALICIGIANAQRATQLRINEVMPVNTDNFQDDYGRHGAWIEIFNSSYATVNIGGCYFTDDINNPKKYLIQKGDVLTRIRPRQHVVFWADNNPSRGTFHLNFELNADKPTFIALFDSNGKTLIDSITVPPCAENVSFGRILDGEGKWGYLAKSTPNTNNQVVTSDAALERFKEQDPDGVGMALTAMSVVFSALLLLYFVFKSIGKISIRLQTYRVQKATGVNTSQATEMVETSGEVLAAIAMALSELDNEVHDIENTVLTINKVGRTYSPWNSKIYMLREQPRR